MEASFKAIWAIPWQTQNVGLQENKKIYWINSLNRFMLEAALATAVPHL
jgi:hypothetical protein